MIRELKMLLQRRLATALFAACVAGIAAPAANAVEMSYGARSPYNGIPNAGSNIVVYNLPAAGSIYAGPVNTSFDLTARVNTPGTESAAGYGLIMTVGGTGGVVFTPIVPVNPNDNSLGLATNPSFPSNASFDLMFANTGIQGGGVQEIDIVALELNANVNNPVNNGDGLASVPFQVAPGVTGNFNVAFNIAPEYTGFVKSLGGGNSQFLTNAGSFPHVGTTIEVRASRRGDMNGDSFADSEDIPGFIASLTNVTTFQANFPYLRAKYISDFNQDTFVDSEDIPGLIAAFGGAPSPSASSLLVPANSVIPEPSTVTLALVGLGVLVLRRRFLRTRSQDAT